MLRPCRGAATTQPAAPTTRWGRSPGSSRRFTPTRTSPSIPDRIPTTTCKGASTSEPRLRISTGGLTFRLRMESVAMPPGFGSAARLEATDKSRQGCDHTSSIISRKLTGERHAGPRRWREEAANERTGKRCCHERRRSWKRRDRRIDPFLMSVLASRFEAIIREMTNAVMKASRSAVIKNAHLVIADVTLANGERAGELVRVPMQPDQVSKAFHRLVRRLGFPCRFHDLRHSHATHLLKGGVHPKVASERLGHASIAITLDTYSHVLPGLQEDAARRVDAALRKALGE